MLLRWGEARRKGELKDPLWSTLPTLVGAYLITDGEDGVKANKPRDRSTQASPCYLGQETQPKYRLGCEIQCEARPEYENHDDDNPIS